MWDCMCACRFVWMCMFVCMCVHVLMYENAMNVRMHVCVCLLFVSMYVCFV